MSFVFPSWSTAFSPAFHEDAKAMLEGALNKGNKPPVIQGRIEVVELHMGEQPPTLTLLEIGDLSLDRFRGILRLGYQGDAWLEVRCRVQANPLSHNPHLSSSILPLSTPLLASQPLLVPMTLRLSKLHLRAILILVVSQSKGITLVFKNDPLQNVDVSSTFDSVEVIRGYLQQEIEGQLREMFREDLPGIIHRLSQRWFTGSGVGGRVEMPYREAGHPSAGLGTPGEGEEGDEDDDDERERDIFPPYIPSTNPSPSAPAPHLTPRRNSHRPRPRSLSNAVSESPTSYTVFPDIEDYDPTYGLRPEGLPTHSGYEAFGRLWEKAREGEGRGLGSLMGLAGPAGLGVDEVDDDILREEEEDRGDVSDGDWEEDDGEKSFDMVEMDHALRSVPRGAHPAHGHGYAQRMPPTPSRRRSGLSGLSTTSVSASAASRLTHHTRHPSHPSHLSHPHASHARQEEYEAEWETFPAVGGGSITRPRVYHAQSQIRAPSEAGGAMPSPSGTATGGSVTARASSVGGASSTIGSLRMRPLHTPSLSAGLFNQPGPSNLRRMVTSRSDVFLSDSRYHHPTTPRSEAYTPHPHTQAPPSAYTHTQRQRAETAASSAARTSGSSWETDRAPSRSATMSMSTLASSQLPSSRPSLAPPAPGGKARPMSMPVPPPAHRRPGHARVPSVSVTHTGGGGLGTSPNNASTAPGSFPPRHLGPGGITLPLNNSVSQLATLSHSAHTLSPYARGHEHIAVRSFPYLGRGGAGGPGSAGGAGGGELGGMGGMGSGVGLAGMGAHAGGGGAGYHPHAGVGGYGGSASYPGSSAGEGARGVDVKAKRKRIFRLGGKGGSDDGGAETPRTVSGGSQEL
ncbi:mitochondrial distribution and morphology protein 34 [Cryptococcus sp. DSM 104549]